MPQNNYDNNMPLIPTRIKAAYMANCYMRATPNIVAKKANKIAKMSEERNYFVTLQRKDRLPWGSEAVLPQCAAGYECLAT